MALPERLIGRDGRLLWDRNSTVLPDPGTLVREIRSATGVTGNKDCTVPSKEKMLNFVAQPTHQSSPCGLCRTRRTPTISQSMQVDSGFVLRKGITLPGVCRPNRASGGSFSSTARVVGSETLAGLDW